MCMMGSSPVEISVTMREAALVPFNSHSICSVFQHHKDFAPDMTDSGLKDTIIHFHLFHALFIFDFVS